MPPPAHGAPLATHKRHLDSGARSQTLQDLYVMSEELGSGHYGKVYRATRKRDGVRVAVKMINKSKTKPEALRAEVDLLRRVGGHPAIVELLDVFDTPEHLQLVMEM